MKEKQSKLLRVFLFVALFFGSLGLSAQTVTKTFRNESLKSVLKEVERQTKMSVIYKVDEVNPNKKVTATFRSTPVREVLNQVLGENLSYEIDNKMITIHKRAVQHAIQQNSNSPKKIVKGRVFDEKGEAVIGATVRVKGTNEATVTDLDGSFSVAASEGSRIEISYMGYTPKEFSANQNNVTVNLAPDEKMLNEVVVTALGIKKEAKALSYNVQQLSNSDITTVKDASFMNSLAGKVAGVEINSSAAGVGGSVKVVMRGAKSLSGNNNALYVIDGVPMPTLSGGSQPNDIFTGMGQSGDGASMVNADDIESISVLSGAAASALYGQDAANGVIMITTKKGKQGKPHVSYSNNTTFYTPFVTPEFQNTYGKSSSGSMYSWGSKLTTPSSYDPLDFYQTGYNEGNSVTFSVGSDKSQTFVSMASTDAQGIVENNDIRRYNFSIRNSTDFLGDKLHLDLSAMYMNVSEQNMISSGYYFNPIVSTYLFPAGDDIRKYMPYEQYDQERNLKTQYWPFGNMGLSMQNPYWVVNRDMFQNHKDRFVLSGGLTWKLAKGISLTGRAKVDKTGALYEKKYSASTETLFASKYGAYYKANEDIRQIYGDAILNMDKYFGDFSVNANIGTSIKDEDCVYGNVGGNLSTAASTANTDLAHGFALGNVTKSTATIEQNNYHHQVQSVFATAQVGYKSMMYVDATARNDWDSSLGETNYKNQGFFYPSVGVSFILTEMLPKLKGKVLSFLKLRGSYSEVGNSPARFVPSLTYPYQNGGIATSTRYPNPNLEPERTKSWEVGLESHFWGNKLNLNVSLYDTKTTNQYFEPALSATSGYTSIGINGGLIENKGIEASLTLNQPLGAVQWTSIFNYTLNRNKIKKLLRPTTIESGETISLDALDVLNLGPVKVRLTEGGSIGDLYVTTLKTDEHGYVIVDYTSKQIAGVDDGKYVYAGNTSPKYSMSWRNSFAWDGFHLGVLVTGRFGGRVVSLTQGWMDSYGVSKATADARDEGGALVNGVRIPAQAFYSIVGPSVGSWYVYNATNVRLAELSFGYDVPIRKIVPWIEGLNVSFVGRNLLMFYNKAPFDPELTASTGTYYTGIDNFMMPSLRNLGFSVKVDF